MGNRAVITFDRNPKQESIGIYLHWNGGAESVLAFCEAANKLGIRDNSDSFYQLARMIQLIGNYFGGTTSLGIGKLKELDCENGDNGLFICGRISTEAGSKVMIRQSKTGRLAESDFVNLSEDEIRNHVYFHPKEGLGIVEQILEKNSAIFKE